MLKLKTTLFIFGLGICFNSFSQNLSPQEIVQKKNETYETCASEAQKQEQSVDKMNKYIISCMERNGFLTQSEYKKQKEQLKSLETSPKTSDQDASFIEFSNQKIRENLNCISKYKNENDVLNCVNNLNQ